MAMTAEGYFPFIINTKAIRMEDFWRHRQQTVLRTAYALCTNNMPTHPACTCPGDTDILVLFVPATVIPNQHVPSLKKPSCCGS